MSFDVIRYLDARNISHSTGKNVSAGNVGIQCFNPMCDDTSNHLGIQLGEGLYSCWKCGTKGDAIGLVMRLDNCDFTQASETVRRYSSGYVMQPQGREVVGEFMLPKFCTTVPTSLHKAYLMQRSYQWDQLANQYGLRFTGAISFIDAGPRRIHYRWRIIIPIYIDGVMVSFTSRDITGHSDARYKAAPDSIAIRPGAEVVYNIDTVEPGARMALVEGPFDVWRIGPGAVAMLGTVFTEEQLVLIASRRPSRVYVVYDSGAADIAEDLGSRMARLVPRVDYLWLDDGDPDTMKPADLGHLQRLLNI
jgi:hypothetical protein